MNGSISRCGRAGDYARVFFCLSLPLELPISQASRRLRRITNMKALVNPCRVMRKRGCMHGMQIFGLVYIGDFFGLAILVPLSLAQPMEPMDSRQWPEPPGASANLLPHWASLSPNVRWPTTLRHASSSDGREKG